MKKAKKIGVIVSIIATALVLGGGGIALVASANSAQYGDWEVKVPATCTEDGQKIRYQKHHTDEYQTAVIPALGHLYLEDNDGWVIIEAPTETTEGTAERICARCKTIEHRPVERLPESIHVDVLDGTTVIARVNVAEDGAYTLSAPEKVGYRFLDFVDAQGQPVANSGTTDHNMQIQTAWELLPTTTLVQLKERAGAGVDQILLTNDLEITESIFVVGKTQIVVEQNVTLTRGVNFAGDLFVVGETAQGDNVLVQNGGVAAELTLAPRNTATLTLDGNKQNMAVDVNGSSILVLNSSVVNLGDGVNLVNAKKVGNSKLLNGYQISYPHKVGGAAVVVVNGTLNLDGATLANNEVNLDETNMSDDDESDNFAVSSCGGAIYNFATVNLYRGSLQNNQASRGGAIYNYRTLHVDGGTFVNNQASVYGGAVYLPGSQYASLLIGENDAAAETVVFANNTAQKSGGAIFGQMKNAVVVKGGATFRNNCAVEGNGGAINTSGALTLDGVTFDTNQAASKGGAIYVYYSNPELTVRQVAINSGLFQNNQASKGGAIALSASSEEFDKGAIGYIGAVTFRANHAFATETDDPELPGETTDDDDTVKNFNGNGGAIYIARQSDVTIDGATFAQNTAERNGGAVYVTGNAQLGMTSTTLSANATDGKGGALYVTSAAQVSINACELVQNVAAVYAGALAVYNGAVVSIKDSQLNQNDATATGNGGAVFGYKATVQTENVTANGNHAKSGGAFFMTTGSVLHAVGTLTMEDNTAASGGAIDFYQKATGTLEQLTVNHNSTTGNGGALYIYTDCHVTIQDLVATNNAAEGKYGGVIYISGAAQLKLGQVTATNNTAGSGGFIYMTTTDTTVEIWGGTANGNTATSGSTIYSNTKKTKLLIRGLLTQEYFTYDGTIEGKLPTIEEPV
ncbi:MAG: hypothetical protein NC133_02850 [Prevotella sp.]|nr:hypothetical protein [Prevotella sp.]